MTFEALCRKMYEEICSHGHPSPATLAEIDAIRGSKPRPFAFWDWYQILPWHAGSPTLIEQERRRLVDEGILEPSSYDHQRWQAEAESHERAARQREEVIDHEKQRELLIRTRR